MLAQRETAAETTGHRVPDRCRNWTSSYLVVDNLSRHVVVSSMRNAAAAVSNNQMLQPTGTDASQHLIVNINVALIVR